jgi:hypothetical protein
MSTTSESVYAVWFFDRATGEYAGALAGFDTINDAETEAKNLNKQRDGYRYEARSEVSQ